MHNDFSPKNEETAMVCLPTGRSLADSVATVRFHCESVWSRRWLIARATLAAAVLGLAATFLVKPQWRTTVLLKEPDIRQLKALEINAAVSLGQRRKLFMDYVKTLSNRENVLAFLQSDRTTNEKAKNLSFTDERKRLAALHKIAQDYMVNIIFHDTANVKDPFRDGSREVKFSTFQNRFDTSSAENLAYLMYTNEKVLNKIVAEQKNFVQNRIIQLERSLDKSVRTTTISRHQNISRREDDQAQNIAVIQRKIEAITRLDTENRAIRLKELEQALQIATTLGIRRYNEPLHVAANNSVNVDVNSNKQELYLKGTDYLKKEIELTRSRPHTLGYERSIAGLQNKLYLLKNDERLAALKARKDDMPYTRKIADGRAELRYLKALDFNVADTMLFSRDFGANVATKPDNLNRNLVVLLFAIAGFLLTFLSVLGTSVISRLLAQEKATSPLKML